MSKTNTPDSLTLALAECLNECIGRGMPLPFHLSAVALNGAIFAARYIEDGGALGVEILAEHAPADGMMRLPINLMIVDATGEAIRVVIQQNGIVYH